MRQILIGVAIIVGAIILMAFIFGWPFELHSLSHH